MIQSHHDRIEGQLHSVDDRQRNLLRDRWRQNGKKHLRYHDRRRTSYPGRYAGSQFALAPVFSRYGIIGRIDNRRSPKQSLLAGLDCGAAGGGGSCSHCGDVEQAYRSKHLSCSYGRLVDPDLSRDAGRHISRSAISATC